jgi:hypothetical protein
VTGYVKEPPSMMNVIDTDDETEPSFQLILPTWSDALILRNV